MGVWPDGGDVIWLPVRYYPKRIAAIQWAMAEWGVTLPQVSCLSRWMRFEPQEWEERWFECEGDEPGAFKVWRLEAA